MATLSYSAAAPPLRSPVEEWQPHTKQSESTTKWWYLTALVHSTTGNTYFLAWCPFHFTGEESSPAFTGLPGHKRLIASIIGFTDYRDNLPYRPFRYSNKMRPIPGIRGPTQFGSSPPNTAPSGPTRMTL